MRPIPPAMPRAVFHGLALSLTLGGGCADRSSSPGQAPPSPEPPADERPDIVLVVVDTLRADHLGTYGYARPTSPRIDAWAAGGVVFERAYAHSGWTLASVASLLTGRLPHEHQVGRHPMDPTCFGRLPPEVETLPERLQAQGYATGAFINNTFLAPEFGLNQGFDRWDWKGSSEDSIRSAEETIQAALSWLDGQDRPAFLLLHLMEPHTLYQPAPDLLGTFSAATPVPAGQEIDGGVIVAWQTYQARPTPEQAARAVALYDEELLGVDRAFGGLWDALQARPRADRTLTVLTADHGEEFWEHDGFEHGHTLMGELTRVPLIAVGPGLAPARVRTVVGHTDLARALGARGGLPQEEGGDAFVLAGLGPYAGPRTVVSENTLYGPPRVSIVDDHHRLDLRQDVMRATLWEVATDGGELRRVQALDVAEQMRPLQSALMQVRGDLAPATTVAGAAEGCAARVADHEVFQQLQALGYLDARPEVPVDQAAGGSEAE